MTLSGNLYESSIMESTEDSASFMVRFLADCPIYEAHFPGMPVTPGACLLQTARELLEKAIAQPLRVTAIKNAKFLSPLAPGAASVKVSISKIKIEDGAVSAKADIADASTGMAYAKISMQAEIA